MKAKYITLAIAATLFSTLNVCAQQSDNADLTKTDTKMVALTFDDGPNTITTPQVLDKLDKFGVVATFFLIGDNINDQSAKVVKRAFDMGCEIANHSRTHSYMTRLSNEEVSEEIKYTSDKIEDIVGVRPEFFRPPYINLNASTYEAVDLTFICGIMGNDWMDNVSAEQRYQMVLNNMKDGSIILLHDMEGNSKTVDALEMLIPELLKQGYKFVTVSDLFKGKGIEPKDNIIYSNVFQQQ